MKRIICVLLAFLLVFSLSGCNSGNPDKHDSAPTLNDSLNQDSDSNSHNNTGSGAGSGSSATVTPPTGSGETQSPDKEEDTTPPSSSTKPNTKPGISTPTEIVSNHTAVKRDEYYQYSQLSTTQKEIYNKMCTAAEKGENLIDLEKYNLSKATVKKIHDAFVADNPQYFYLSKYYSYTINSKSGKVLEFELYYSDGTTEDDFDDEGNAISTADREVINQKIRKFNKKVSDILASIPSNISDLEKEKLIYEYILDNVAYDSETADAVKQNSDIITHSFDVYGAAFEGVSVCEGYAKLFQYLCYCVGINATQVQGYSNGNHMWNAVEIDGQWYMIDLTWDDPDKDRLYYYKYFNLTTAEIEADHVIETDNLSVPVCTASDAAFYKNFALIPVDGTDMPENFKMIIDRVMQNGDKYLCIYRGTESEDLSQFIDFQIYSPRSQFRAYVAEKDYGVILGERYLITNRYYYIQIA